jgi:hypothetical protein
MLVLLYDVCVASWQTGDVCKILFMGLLVDPRVHDAEPLRL